MRAADIERLRELHMFKKMSARQFERLTQAASFQRYPPNTLLVSEGAQPDFLHILVEGCVELFASHNGRHTTIDIVRATTLIFAAVILDQPYLISARTLLESRVLLIPAKDVRAAFREDADFAFAATTELSECYRGLVRLLKDQKLRSTPERLANWLLRNYSKHGDGLVVTLEFEKKTLASLLGTTPENLSRALAQLGTAGVATSGRTITITDKNALVAFASPSPLMDGTTD
jgi:CRP/FNR family transcriptional activator FtrB